MQSQKLASLSWSFRVVINHNQTCLIETGEHEGSGCQVKLASFLLTGYSLVQVTLISHPHES